MVTLILSIASTLPAIAYIVYGQENLLFLSLGMLSMTLLAAAAEYYFHCVEVNNREEFLEQLELDRRIRVVTRQFDNIGK